jgi:lipoate-protein ligase A
MDYLDLTLPTLEENLALDEALLRQAEAGGPEVLRFWEWHNAVVLGAGCRLAEEVHEAACVQAGVPIRRRSSGGGTVLLGAGCLCFSLVLAYDRAPPLSDINASYRYILGRIRDALSPLAPGLEHSGISDLSLAGRKVSGNSQQRKRTHLLHHGTLLYAFDVGQAERFLPLPARQPDYRGQRSHTAFLANLPVTAEELRSGLGTCWEANQRLGAVPEEEMRRLVAEKYSCEDWIRRR